MVDTKDVDIDCVVNIEKAYDPMLGSLKRKLATAPQAV